MKKKILIMIAIATVLFVSSAVIYKMGLMRRETNVVEYRLENPNVRFKLEKGWKGTNDKGKVSRRYEKRGYEIRVESEEGFEKVPEVQIAEWHKNFYDLVKKIKVGGYEVYIPDIEGDYDYEAYENIRIEPYVIDEETRKIYPFIIGDVLYKFELAPPRDTKKIDKDIAKEYYDFLESIEFER